MNVNVQGKQLDVGDALRTHVSDRLADLNGKFFGHAIEGSVIFSREGHGFYRAHITIHIGRDIVVQSVATEDDPYLSFDVASGKLARQMRRYKNRLRDHHERMERASKDEVSARDVVFAAPAAEQDNEVEAGDDPVVVAEMTTPIRTMAVADAVMQLDLMETNALMFKNASHGRLNMVYRRNDGNIGWVDPA